MEFILFVYNSDELSYRINHQNLVDENFFTDITLNLVKFTNTKGNCYIYLSHNSSDKNNYNDCEKIKKVL